MTCLVNVIQYSENKSHKAYEMSDGPHHGNAATVAHVFVVKLVDGTLHVFVFSFLLAPHLATHCANKMRVRLTAYQEGRILGGGQTTDTKLNYSNSSKQQQQQQPKPICVPRQAWPIHRAKSLKPGPNEVWAEEFT